MTATTFRYRAIRGDGAVVSSEIEAASLADAMARLRRDGATPIELRASTRPAPVADGKVARNKRDRNAARALIGELAVLLKAGLPLDRALGLAIGNAEDGRSVAAMGALLREVREGAALSSAMLANPALFTPGEAAMAEAGEANGLLGEALERLALMLEQDAELRRMVATAMIYPIALLVIAVGVILMMLLFVVPQFEHLITTSRVQLPAATVAVMAASRFVRDYGLVILGALAIGVLALRQGLSRPSFRVWLDRALLGVPQLGELLRRIETARLAHTLGALLAGGVALPNALALSRRTIGNSVISGTVGRIAEGVREGGGLSGPLAASGVLPPLAIGFIRTGEETSQLALMLDRLAVVLDRDVKTRLERLVAFLTPAITVVLGATVATIIAAIMSAILGFNDLAVAS
jgi:general secretion pathway protein F